MYDLLSVTFSFRSLQQPWLYAAAALLFGQSVRAQTRDLQRYSADDVEGRLMAFYSAALSFTPVGQIHALRPGGIQLSLELAYVPSLNAAQRSAGYDKPEATNLAPVYPRPRVRAGLPSGLAAELSWLPPVRVFGVTANLAAAALTVPLAGIGPARVSTRLSGMAGRVTGPITCNAEISTETPDLRTYYRTVCRGRDSRDHFEPRHLTLELIGTRDDAGEWQPYAGVGARADAGTRFDIGVANPDGSYRDPDHPVLELRSVRPHAIAGATWTVTQWGMVAGEILYAPGSLVTARTLFAVRVR